MEKKDFRVVWNWYSREDVQKALLEVAKDREVVVVYKDLSFGKRPDILQYPSDILQSVAEGAVAFHGSVERWCQPMNLNPGMIKEQLDELRIGWDILIDPDVPDFEIGKIVTKIFVKALRDHNVKNIFVKFTGGKGFHIAIPFESLPKKVNFQETSKLYPNLYHKILEYLKFYVKDELREKLLELDNPINLARRVNKNVSEILEENEIDPFKIVSIDLFGSRHLFRLPYSLNEKTYLVSLPIDWKKIDEFEKEMANPNEVKVKRKFLVLEKELKERDASNLVIEALDWFSKQKIEIKEVAKEIPEVKPKRKIVKIPEKYFPPCIKKILNGLNDGRKRSIFILVTFLRNMGWSNEEIEKKIYEWNSKNKPPLRENWIRTQLRWHFRQERNLLPPNCDNPTFYKDFGVCEPDEICSENGKIVIKNPMNYAFKLLKIRPKRRKKRKRKKKKS